MRLSELLRREDAESLICQTLASGWSEQFNQEIRISPSGTGQAWRYQSLLSVIVTPDIEPAPRQFVRELFRFSPRPWRVVPQWFVGTALPTSAGLRFTSHPFFRATPGLQEAQQVVVLPGNQRIRTLHFGLGTTRVFLKTGFSDASIKTEVAIRGAGQDGPFIPIERHDPNWQWFEESIFDGFALSRCPTWFPKARLAKQALDDHDQWLRRSRRELPTSEHCETRLSTIRSAISDMHSRFPEDSATLDELVRLGTILASEASAAPTCAVGVGHGDLQAGNILVDRKGQRAWLSDWEASAEQYEHYDRMVFALHMRAPSGLARRIQRYVDGHRTPAPLSELPQDREWRHRAVSLSLLENLRWQAEQCASGVYSRVPPDLTDFLGELRLYCASGS